MDKILRISLLLFLSLDKQFQCCLHYHFDFPIASQALFKKTNFNVNLHDEIWLSIVFFFKTRRLLLTKNLKEKNWNLLYVLCPKYISPSDITFVIYSVKTNNKVHQKECQTYFQNQITSANKTSGSYWFISWYRSWFVTYNQIVCFLYNCASISIIISFAIVPFHENYTDWKRMIFSLSILTILSQF